MINITLKQLRVFQAVAETKSYTRAAEQLHMTQPAVSMQMKHLKETVGLALFETQGKKIVMTSAGEKFKKHAEDIIQGFLSLQDSIASLKNKSEQITISAATTANHFITHMMADFSQEFPDINIKLDITNRESLVHQLRGYDRDFVIMGEPPKNLDIKFTKIMENPLIVIASAKHPMALLQKTNKKIPMKEIAKESFVVREEGSGTKAAIQTHFEHFQYQFKSSYEMSSNESIKHAVVAGLGLGIVALHTVKLELEAGKLVKLDVENFPLERYWNLVSRKRKKLSKAALKFQEFIFKSAPSYQQSYEDLNFKQNQ